MEESTYKMFMGFLGEVGYGDLVNDMSATKLGTKLRISVHVANATSGNRTNVCSSLMNLEFDST